jgi:hypothetical protein
LIDDVRHQCIHDVHHEKCGAADRAADRPADRDSCLRLLDAERSLCGRALDLAARRRLEFESVERY